MAPVPHALPKTEAPAPSPAVHTPAAVTVPLRQPEPMHSVQPIVLRNLKGPTFDVRPRLTDPMQGDAGDCYFIGAMSAVAQRSPELVRNAITELPDGNFKVRLYQPREDRAGRSRLVAVDVIVDKKVPTMKGAPAYAQGRYGNWPAILEKAFASMKGSYTKIGNGGYGKDALEALTGKRAEDFGFDAKTAPKAIERMEQAISDGRPVMVSTRFPKDFIAEIARAKVSGRNPEARDKLIAAANPDGGSRLVEAMDKFGLIAGHQYVLLGVGMKDGKKMIVLRNPWGWLTPSRAGIGNGEVNQDGNGVYTLPADEFGFLFDDAVAGAPIPSSPTAS